MVIYGFGGVVKEGKGERLRKVAYRVICPCLIWLHLSSVFSLALQIFMLHDNTALYEPKFMSRDVVLQHGLYVSGSSIPAIDL